MKVSTLLDLLPPSDACRNQSCGILRRTGNSRESTPSSSHPLHGQDILLHGVNKYLCKGLRGHRETCDHTSSVLDSDIEDFGEFFALGYKMSYFSCFKGASYGLFCPMHNSHLIKFWWTNWTRYLLLLPLTDHSWRVVMTVMMTAAIY